MPLFPVLLRCSAPGFATRPPGGLLYRCGILLLEIQLGAATMGDVGFVDVNTHLLRVALAVWGPK